MHSPRDPAHTYRYAFILGREWKLSLAELGSILGWEGLEHFTPEIAIFTREHELEGRILERIGGTIRIIRVLGETDPKRFPTDVIAQIKKHHSPPHKLNFALGSYGTPYPLSDIGLRVKKTLHQDGYTARIVNAKNSNINAAVFKKEKLAKTQTEYNLIHIA